MEFLKHYKKEIGEEIPEVKESCKACLGTGRDITKMNAYWLGPDCQVCRGRGYLDWVSKVVDSRKEE